MFDHLVATTGWSRANAGRALTAAGKCNGTAKAVKRKPRIAAYGCDTLKPLIQVRDLADKPSGKYLTATIRIRLSSPVKSGQLDKKRLSGHKGARLPTVLGLRSMGC